MTIWRWSRASKIGAFAALAVVTLLCPFLVYAGIAVASFSSQRGAAAGIPGMSTLAGVLAGLLYVVAIIGIPVTLGALLGATVSRVVRLF